MKIYQADSTCSKLYFKTLNSQPAFTCSKLNLFKVSNNNTTTSSLMFNHSNAFIFNFEHILILALIIYLSPRFTHFSSMFRFNIPLNNWFSKVFQGCSKEHCPEMASCFQQSANPFPATSLFLQPLKTSGNLWIYVFRRYRKRQVA